MACQECSSRTRCCGSVISASEGVIPKNSASKRSIPSMQETAGTCRPGEMAALFDSSSETFGGKKRTNDSPRHRRFQKVETSEAPGKDPDNPMIASFPELLAIRNPPSDS